MTKLLSFLLLLLGFVLANGFVTSSSSSSPSSASATTASSVQPRYGSVTSTTKSTCLDSSASSASSAEEITSTSSSLTNNHDNKDAVISRENWELLSKRAQLALSRLIQHEDTTSTRRSQAHVYDNWPTLGIDDEGKIRLGEQIADLDESYPGGLPAYLTKAKLLLAQSALGSNPFNDFVAHVPEGESLSYYDTNDDDTTCTTSTNNNNNKSNNSNNDRMTFAQAEQIGLSGISNIAFVLVAGGLGERLGYSGIKLGLSTNILTETCYLEVYCQYILALQRLATTTNTQQQQHVPIKIPLVIMTSDDTDPLTRKLLIENNNFGLDTSQIQIIKQDKVAALINSDASLSMVSKYVIETKPHGHGDVHHLLYKSGIVDTWYNSGTIKHVIFLQDTNALVINSVIPTLGVSIARGYHMNSICIPRLAGEAAGAIARLEHKTDPTNKSLVINVEYNQLGPLLSSQGDKRGDVPDPTTGYSLYPGNANNIIIELSSYHKTLHGVDQGVVDEFVNPKYKDETVRTEFKKPTRLECMMQDYPKLLQKEVGSSNMKIGFTLFDRWFTFSPAKNSLSAGVEDVKKGGTAPGTMSSAESDKYIQNQRKLKHAGVDINVTSTKEDLVSLAGIPITPGPRIILSSSFAITQRELFNKIGSGNRISNRSSLVVDGENIHIMNLNLDGALVIRTGEDCHVTIDGLVVHNKGYEFVEVDSSSGSEVPEEVVIRGYTMEKHEVMEIIITEPGTYNVGSDGTIIKM